MIIFILVVALQVIVILAGLLPDTATSVAVMGVSFDITTITYMLPAGISGENTSVTLFTDHLIDCLPIPDLPIPDLLYRPNTSIIYALILADAQSCMPCILSTALYKVRSSVV